MVPKSWSSSTRHGSYFRQVRATAADEHIIPFKFVQIHDAQRGLMEEEKDHKEVFMAQLLAHNRGYSDPVYGTMRTPRWT